MTATTVPTPLLFIIWHREQRKGARWRKAGRAGTHAEAVTLIGGKGDWHIAPVFDPVLAGSEGIESENATGATPGPFPSVIIGPGA